MSFLRSINSGKEEQIQKLATDIHKAFDANNDGIVGELNSTIALDKCRTFFFRSTRIFNWFCFNFDG